MTNEVQLFDGSMDGITLPRWRIDKDTGHFTHDFGDMSETLKVAILKVDRSRTLWPERYIEGNQALCRSHNTLWPEERSRQHNQYGVERDGLLFCAGCPLAEWREENGQPIKPRCAEGWNLLLLDMDTGILGVLSLSRTRAKIAKNLEGFWRMTKLRFPVTLTTEKVKGPSGQWYNVDFRRGEAFDDGRRQHLIEIAVQFKVSNLSAVADDENGHRDDEDDLPY